MDRSRLRRCAGMMLADLTSSWVSWQGKRDQDNRRDHINNIMNQYFKF